MTFLKVVGIWGFKSSILLPHLQFMPNGLHHKLTIAMFHVSNLSNVAFMLAFMFMCIPVGDLRPGAFGGNTD